MKESKKIKQYDKVKQIIENEVAEIESTYDYIRIAKKGIKARTIENFSNQFGINKEKTANLLAISEPTLYRWIKANKKLNRNFAIKLLEITDIFIYGIEIFQSKENFLKWLDLPNTALGGMKPFELLEYPTGISKVRDVLGRIEHGVFS